MTGSAAWTHPEMLPVAFVGLAGLGALWLLGWRRAGSRLERLMGRRLSPRTLRTEVPLWIALLALAVAGAGPRIGERTIWVPAGGVDLVLLLDVSRSMDARDTPPSRLDRARRLARELLRGLDPGDRAALAGYAGRGVLLTPLTPDLGALDEMLSGVDTELIQPQGSQLGDGLRAALEAFPPDSDRPRVVVIFGDGEDPASTGRVDPGPAARAGARIVAVGLGSERGAEIPDHGLALRDARSEIVRSRRDLGSLRRLAAGSGGALFAADAWGGVGIEGLLEAVRRDAGAPDGPPVPHRVPARRTGAFVALAFLWIWIDLARPFGSSRAGRRRRLRAGGAALAGLALVAAPGLEAVGGTTAGSRSARAAIARGVEAAARGEVEAAARHFQWAAVAAPESSLAALAYFDLGVAELGRERFEAARDAFLDALALAPDDFAARYNLEWALRELARQAPDATPQIVGAREASPAPEPAGETIAGDEPAPIASETAPASSAREVPEAAETPDADAGSGGRLPPEEVTRWLDSVRDDAAQALRRTAADEQRRARRSPGPAW